MLPKKKAVAKGKKRARSPELPQDQPQEGAEDVSRPVKRAKRGKAGKATKKVTLLVERDTSEVVAGANTSTMKATDNSTTVPVEDTLQAAPVLVSTVESAAPAKPTFNLTGNFDIYAMLLQFLVDEFLPSGSTTPQYEELYKSILSYQAKSDWTGQSSIPKDFAKGKDGTFHLVDLADPMECLPYEVRVTSIEEAPELKFTEDELDDFVHFEDSKRAGITGRLELAEGSCGVTHAFGHFKLRPVWEKVAADGKKMELFDGYANFEVRFSSLYQRKGHGGGLEQHFAFWAVRGKQ